MKRIRSPSGGVATTLWQGGAEVGRTLSAISKIQSENPGKSDGSKHIDYRVHSLQERIQDRNVRLVDCKADDLLADVMTKNLLIPAFVRYRTVMSGQAPNTSPRISLPKSESTILSELPSRRRRQTTATQDNNGRDPVAMTKHVTVQ